VKKVCFVTTSPLIVNFFLVPHLVHLARRYQVSLAVTQPGEVPLRPLPGVEVIALEIPRRIEPLRDAAALLRLRKLYRSRGFDLVHSFGPKAGLLSTAAGRVAGIRVRLHTFTGQVWAARSGVMRRLLRSADACTARFATHLLADSNSQREFLEREGVVPRGRCEVLAGGSVSGVDLRRFRPDAQARAAVREESGIGNDELVVLYLGRITRDKGVLDLARGAGGKALLLLVGPDEEGLRKEILRLRGPHAARTRFVGYSDTPERYLAAADVLCLPSYREGFGSVVIEAAAAGIPAVASRIYGVVDAVADGRTGLLFTPGDTDDLARKLDLLLVDRARRRGMGSAARARAVAEFSQERLVGALEERYHAILAEQG
jgi:glycosyltransferase involved in cell wall biosynthesis